MMVLLFSATSMDSKAFGSRLGASPLTSDTKTCTVMEVIEIPSVTEKVMESSSVVRPACSYCRTFLVMSLDVKVSPEVEENFDK